MWPTIKFLGTLFISFIAMIGALGAENPFPLFAVAWGIWIIYIVSLRSKRKKELDKERLIREILDKLQNSNRNFKDAKVPNRKKQNEPKLTSVKPILERKGFFMCASWTRESKNPIPRNRATIRREFNILTQTVRTKYQLRKKVQQSQKKGDYSSPFWSIPRI